MIRLSESRFLRVLKQLRSWSSDVILRPIIEGNLHQTENLEEVLSLRGSAKSERKNLPKKSGFFQVWNKVLMNKVWRNKEWKELEWKLSGQYRFSNFIRLNILPLIHHLERIWSEFASQIAEQEPFLQFGAYAFPGEWLNQTYVRDFKHHKFLSRQVLPWGKPALLPWLHWYFCSSLHLLPRLWDYRVHCIWA